MRLKNTYLLYAAMLLLILSILNQYSTIPELEYVVPPPDQTITKINVVLTAFNNSGYPEAADFITVYDLANEYIQRSSGGRMKLEIVKISTFTAKYSESYYGLDNELADINLIDLLFEIETEISNEWVTIIYHPGISQNLFEGNSSGIIDQYLGQNFYGPINGIPENYKAIFLSQFGPYSIFVHELGHSWNLSDQYFGGMIGKYGMMGSGFWHVLEGQPADFSAASKFRLGWLDYYNITPSLYNTYEFSIDDAIKIGSIFIEYITAVETNSPGIIVTNLLGHKLLLIEHIDTQAVVNIQDLVISIKLDKDVIRFTLSTSNIDIMKYVREGGFLIAFLFSLPLANRFAGRTKENTLYE